MIAGRYQLGEVLGVGSFATVYRATDDLLEDTVVVKMLAENHSLNPEIRERFIAEGRSLRRVASEHVVTVHDIGEAERQQPFLVLELADRGTLAGRVRSLRAQGWRPDATDMLSMARPLAQALEAIHAAQLVHRDLSPGNLLLATESAADGDGPGAQLVAADERLLLSDLGMCKDLAINSGLTVSGGTAGFRPPEQSQPG
ncbi:MAG: serine/threonine protein kinase, partial [Yaniella sp.]|nr:serine/threonine protein kinase [Yaniella sp.]